MKKVLALFMAMQLFSGVAYAAGASDALSDYRKAMKKEADANAVNVYNVWSDNTAYRIENMNKPGIVIDGAADNDIYHSDGVGNVTVKSGANVTGPIINKQEVHDSTIVINPNKRKLR